MRAASFPRRRKKWSASQKIRKRLISLMDWLPHRSPKFILAPVYSCTPATPPPPPAFGLIHEGAIGSAKKDDITL